MSTLPMVSLGLSVNVTNGYNQIQRSIGSYRSLYQVPGSRIVDVSMQLNVGQVYNSNPGETTSALIVSTGGPLVFQGTRSAGGTVTLNVTSQLILDDSFSSWSLTNNGSAQVALRMNAVNYTSLSPVDPVYYGAAVAPGSLTAGFIQGLANAVYTNKNQTVTVDVTTGESLFYAYPNNFDESQFSINGVSGGMTLAGVVQLTVPSGSQDYYVYQSTATGIGSATLIVTDV